MLELALLGVALFGRYLEGSGWGWLAEHARAWGGFVHVRSSGWEYAEVVIAPWHDDCALVSVGFGTVCEGCKESLIPAFSALEAVTVSLASPAVEGTKLGEAAKALWL